MTSAVMAIPERRSVDLPVPRSQPDYLAAVARLRGMQPADVAAARVLELGCRTGRNLIPMAERYPESVFLGIDDSEDRVAAARAAAGEQGLTNIEFQRRDLASLELPPASFDFLVAEGFYSWIDDAARRQLLKIIRTVMAPQGVAYISYRTYPGNYIPEMLGTMFRYEARNASDILERVKRGRGMAQFLHNSLVEDTPYNTLLKAELTPINEQDDGALARNYLATGARPVYLRQFVSELSQHRLQFIGDGAVSIAYTDNLGQVIEDRLSRVAHDPLEREQYRDVLRNRRYRQTLVCHADVEIDRELSAKHFAGLWLEGRISPEDPEIKM